MASSNSIDALKGTWDYVSGDDNDAYLKELGVGMMTRVMARGIKPRIVIAEKDGQWTLRTETIFKTMIIDFTPNSEYDETTPDGRELKGVIQFENGKWVQRTRDKCGKESVVIRWIDEQDQMQITSQCGKATVGKVYKRVQDV